MTLENCVYRGQGGGKLKRHGTQVQCYNNNMSGEELGILHVYQCFSEGSHWLVGNVEVEGSKVSGYYFR